MIFNLPESKDKEEDLSKVKEVLNYVNSEEVVDYLSTNNFSRLGKSSEGNQRPRPIKLVFQDSDTKWQFIKRASRLRNSDSFNKVGLSVDKTTKERNEDAALREKLKGEKQKRPDDDLVIFRKQIVKRTDIPGLKKSLRAQSATLTTNGAVGGGEH